MNEPTELPEIRTQTLRCSVAAGPLVVIGKGHGIGSQVGNSRRGGPAYSAHRESITTEIKQDVVTPPTHVTNTKQSHP